MNRGGIHHRPRGAGGPPLLLLHGFLGSPRAWDAVLAALPHHGPAWCPWLPGHGPALPLPADWDAAVAGLAAALPAGGIVAGYSMGARLALAAALRRPDAARATLLVSGHPGPADAASRAERAAADAARAAALRQGTLADFVAAWEALPLFSTQQALPAAALRAQRAQRLGHDARALAWSFERGGQSCMPDLRGAIAATPQRLRLLTGALDRAYDELGAALARPPHVAHRSVAGVGHNLLLEAPAAVAASIALLMKSPWETA
ncbi:MAG: alpha/beta fold hydrolase [Burkholderiales bacterium]|nr:alpha/beta fold hydrolase [Burkholderiales bacterium]